MDFITPETKIIEQVFLSEVEDNQDYWLTRFANLQEASKGNRQVLIENLEMDIKHFFLSLVVATPFQRILAYTLENINWRYISENIVGGIKKI